MGKSGNHKNENTFRFQTFSERITHINIDVIHQIRHHDDTPEETGTYFGEALQKQSELNCTDHFVNFKKEIVNQVQTFAQLVYNEDKIVDALKKHLAVPDSMALPALLDLLVQLARDLQKDFYGYFTDFFHILVKLLNTYTQNVEVLESAFTCLSYLFKFLWRYLLRDIQEIYSLFSSLISKKYKEYVRNFAAESFAFLMRKCKDQSGLFDFMLLRLEDEPDKAEGVGRLFFEMMKGIKEQFHSCTSHVFPILLEKLGPKEKQSPNSLPWQQVEVAVTSSVLSMANFSNKEQMAMIWDILLEATESVYKRFASTSKRAEKMQVTSTLERLLRIVKASIDFNQGKVVTKPDTIAKVLLEYIRGPSLPDCTGAVLLEVTGSLLITSHTKIQVENSSRLLPAVFKTEYPVQNIYDFTKRLFDLPLFEKDILPALLKYTDSNMKSSDDVKELTLLLLTELILNKSPLLNDGRDIDGLEAYMLDFGTSNRGDSFPSYVVSCIDTKLSSPDPASLAKVWSGLVCLPHVRPLKNKDKVVKKLASLMKQIIEIEPVSDATISDSLSAIVCQCLVTMVMMLTEQEVFQHVSWELIAKAVCAKTSNVHVLRLADAYFTHAVNEGYQDILSVNNLLKMFPSLQGNLSSPLHMVRLLTLRILSSFDLPLPESDIEVTDVFTVCLNAEMTAATIHEYREKLRHLQKLEYTAVQNSIPAGPFGQVPVRYLIGSLYINFKLLWEPTRTLLSSHAHSMERDAFWEIYAKHLETASKNAEEELNGSSSSSSQQLEDRIDQGLVSEFSKNVVSLNGNSVLQPDYSNFRIQLWKAMHEFPERCSPKSRILVPLLFRFLKNEYYMADMNVAPSQNVSRGSADDIPMDTDDADMANMSVDSPSKPEKVKSRTEYNTRLRERTESNTVSEIGDSDGDSNNEDDIDDDLSESDDDDDDNDDMPISNRTRNHDKLAETNKKEVGVKRAKGKKEKAGSVTVDSMEVDSDRNNRGKKRMRTKSTDEDDEKEKSSKRRIGGKIESTRRNRTRSSNLSSDEEDDDELNDSDHSDNDEDDEVEDSDVDDVKSKLGKDKKVSAIKGKDAENLDVTVSEVDEERPVADVSEKLGKQKRTAKVVKKKKKAATGSLLVKLELFAKFKDPMSMFMEPKLKQLYFDLLIHKNADVQKTAFQCIMTYKHSYLIPYRENFNRLLEDKSFKNEIVLFSIDHENGTISEEHRKDVLPVLMRILYGKMHVKTGKGTSGKQYSNVRQSIVFRFLNGCQSDELKIFVDLIFAPFKHLVTDNPLSMVKDIIENTDLTNVLPVKKMQGALNSINVIFKKLGHRLDAFLPDIIQIIFGLGSLCGVLLGNRYKLVPHVINPLKSIRQNVLYRIIQILVTYDKYPWQPVEIDAMYEALVWPQLEKLSNESLYHPTPLLKLFSCCAKNPRYLMLLCKHPHDNQKLSPLLCTMELLLHQSVSSQVTKFIMEMICNLLREMDEEEEVKYVEITNALPLKSVENVRDIDVGIRLLLPHIGGILVYIQRFVTKLNTQMNKKSSLSVKELEILSRISSFVQDEEMSSTLVNLLLPFLHPKLSKPLKVEEEILRSIINLLKQITDRLGFFQPVSKLFASLSARTSRILLAEAFSVVCEKDEVLLPLATIVQQLNSWDRTRMDEPNYMLRLEGYRSATTMLKEMVTIDTRTCLTLIYNCCFFISTVEDMSLRDSSTICMITMVNQFGSRPFDDHAYNKVILGSLLPEVKAGMKTKKQTVFHEFVSILMTLVDTFGNQSTFSDLKPLRDKDVEADFFENIKHIQVYKRSRALRRLMKYLTTTKVSFSTLSNIFLPMVSTFLVDDSYKKHMTVLEAAIESIGTICRLLPWKSYLNQLKHYLALLPKKLERQKLLVRVIVSILDNFHFDLSQSTLNVKNAPVPKVEREPEENVENQTEKILEDEKKEMEVDGEDGEEKEVVPEINEATETEPVVIGKEKQLCAEPLATKIHTTILKNVIHHLHKILVQKANTDSEHKTNKSKYAEDEEILRVPIALAMIKLLQNLPKGALQRYLPGILLKVCNFLRSRSIEIRNTSRDTLVKIQTTLGPRFFPFILSELKGTLRRGYQRHVLCYTVHQLLKNMESVVQPGDIDVCLYMLQQVLNEEIFGEQSDEKDIAGIKAKVFEARSSKSYESYEFIARYINPGSLIRLMGPINTILDTTRSHKSARKVQELLKKVTSGLMENKNMTVETLLVFVHSLTTETLPILSVTKSKETKPVEQKDKPGQKPASCLLIPYEAPRGGLKPKTNKKTNKHILVEFGLQLLGMCLRKQKAVASDNTHVQMLDPLVSMLSDCLYSKYVIVNANSLRVLCKLLKFPLPSLKKHIKTISSGMFILLRNYASAGAVRGDNLELVSMLFKAVTVLVRDVKVYNIQSSEVQVLLTFCEEDIHDHNRQSTAFSLLKAILSRKLDKPEIHELMLKVEEMSISAESPHVQRECRQVMMQYLLDYPLGKKLVDHLKFYISQLSFELETGRESALEMMASFFTSFPQNVLAKHSGLFFVPMAASLANDESPKCRKLIALALKTLLGNLDNNSRTGLYNIAKKWFMDHKLKLRSLAAQLCGLFVEVECTQFESRLSDILPVIEQQLEPGKYKQVDSESVEHDQDLMIYHTLNTLLKILRECNSVISSPQWESDMTGIWEHVETYLSYPHIWVQLSSCQLFGLLFAAYQPDQLVTMETDQTGYFGSDTVVKLRRLALDFLSQLQSELLNDDLASQVIKNMIFITKCARYIVEDDVKDTKQQDETEEEDKTKKLTVLWLVRKMIREAHHEAINNNKMVIKRMHVFKWLAAVSLDIGESMETSVLSAMLPPLQRELNDQSMYQDENLRNLAQEVVELLKKSVGVEKFTGVYAGTQKVRAERRDERKKQRAIQAVANPELAAKRKLKKNLGKIEAKKRKADQYNILSKKAKKKKYQEFSLKD